MIAKALEIREKVLGSGHIGVAYTLSQLASVHERLGWHGEDQENMLKRALDIFSRGQHQQEVLRSDESSMISVNSECGGNYRMSVSLVSSLPIHYVGAEYHCTAAPYTRQASGWRSAVVY